MIVVRIYEGLGNQMFEYAYAFALSERMKEKGIQVFIDMRDEAVTSFDKIRFGRPLLLKQFNVKLSVASADILKKWDYLSEKNIVQKTIRKISDMGLWKYGIFKEHDFNYNKENIKIKDNTFVEGWFQHYQYFEKYRKALLSEFTLKEDFLIPKSVKKIMSDYQVISIHVRRGDYITNPIARKSMGICGVDYYLKAVEYLKGKLNKPYVFIFTNDQAWVEKNLQFDIPYTVISERYQFTDVQEMVLMSQCHHNVIANSTFSWWGAWLNMHSNKIVIAPKKWFLDSKRKNIAMHQWVKL